MFTRLIRRKRPRRPTLAMFGAAAVAAGLVAAVALALVSDTGTYDITVADKNHSAGPLTLTPSGGSVQYIGSSAQNQASGTGLFDPFVRLQGGPTEKGYNTDGAVAFDTKSGTWTHAIKVNAIPVVDCDGSGPGTATCWELFNDINENNTTKRISLNVVEVWFTTNPSLVGYVDPTGFPSGATKEYEFNGNILINDVNQGSGRGDLRYLIPTAGHTWTSATYFVLYSKWGTTTGTAGANGTGGYSADGGFEEWKVRKTPNVNITKTADASPVDAGTTIGFTITITNSGVADATGVSLSDSLPGGTGVSPVHWTKDTATGNPTAFAISGADGSQALTLAGQPITLAAGTSLTVHITAATTQDNCGQYDNTASFTSTNAGTGTASDSITVNCGALLIKKESTKGTNPLVSNAGAVFSVAGPSPATTSFNVTDDTTAAAPDEDALAGEVCVGGLQPGTYTINEVSPPTGYAAADSSQADQSVTVVNGTNCTTSLPGAGATATFTNAPLSDIQVNFRDGGSGETTATISCDNTTGSKDTTKTSGWDTSDTETGISAPVTVTCTITIDP